MRGSLHGPDGNSTARRPPAITAHPKSFRSATGWNELSYLPGARGRGGGVHPVEERVTEPEVIESESGGARARMRRGGGVLSVIGRAERGWGPDTDGFQWARSGSIDSSAPKAAAVSTPPIKSLPGSRRGF
ncbi:hypothetical protein NHX12_030043 [Muraenolepis orangiensis]|uniref:Uncharacterized protein n=1 Tax=Muraenolepis orangiensis TaxID=630683 RepID=A0A9Q0E7E0_9TELE|nr:hypothetical protein NHX12_030043 [Muraenolepis orangiensis]